MSDFWNDPAARIVPSQSPTRPKRRPRWPYVVAAGVVAVTAISLIFGEPQNAAVAPPQGEELSPWPFTVDRVTLYCEVVQPAAGVRIRPITVDVGGKRYGVNGTGKGTAPDVSEVATTTDTQALIFRGLALCDAGDESVILRRPVATGDK